MLTSTTAAGNLRANQSWPSSWFGTPP